MEPRDAARLDVARIVAAFAEVGGDEAAAAAHAFWSTHDDATMAKYAEHCVSLYHSEPLTDQLTRCVVNFSQLTGFEGEMELDLRAGLSQVHVPALVLAGRRDPIKPLAAAEEIVESLPGPDVLLKVFDDSSHFFHLAEPERSFSVLRSFIAD